MYEEGTESWDLHKEYLWGIRYIDDIIATIDHTGTSEECNYHIQDINWNVVMSFDTNGDPVEYVTYDPYGKPTIWLPFSGGYWVRDTDIESDCTDHLFQGRLFMVARYNDAKPKRLYDFRNRTYCPILGRFLQRDPIGDWGDGINLGNGYGFVGGRPTAFVDPSGLFFCISYGGSKGEDGLIILKNKLLECGLIVKSVKSSFCKCCCKMRNQSSAVGLELVGINPNANRNSKGEEIDLERFVTALSRISSAMDSTKRGTCLSIRPNLSAPDIHNKDTSQDSSINPSAFPRRGIPGPNRKNPYPHRSMCALLIHALMEAYHGSPCMFTNHNNDRIKCSARESYMNPQKVNVGAHQKALAEENFYRENMNEGDPLTEADPGNQKTVDGMKKQIDKNPGNPDSIHTGRQKPIYK